MEKKLHKHLAAQTGLRYDAQSDTFSGVRNGYLFLITSLNDAEVEVKFCIRKNHEPPTMQELDDLFHYFTFLQEVKADGDVVRLVLHDIDPEGLSAKARSILDELPTILRKEGFENTCQKCHAEGITSFNMASGEPLLLCNACITALQPMPIREEPTQVPPVVVEGDGKKGLLGGLLGGALGCLLLVLLDRWGILTFSGAILSGMLVGFLYRKFAEGKTKHAIGITVVIALVMGYLAEHLSWMIELHKVYPHSSWVTCFLYVPFLAADDMVSAGSFYMSFLLTMGLAAFGVVVGQAAIDGQRK